MDLQSRRPVRNYLSGREQRRLLMLVASLGLVLFLMNEARKSENWKWLADLDSARQAKPLPPGAEGRETAEDGTPIKPLPDFDRDTLKAVRDDTTFRDEEQAAWFGLLCVLKDADPRALAKASLGKITYVQLFDQPNVYRGKPVTLGGVIRRARYWEAPKNDFGIDGYYRAVLDPDDDSGNPIIVYVLRLPDGFPIGKDIAANVTFTGYFFKRWVYQSGNGLRTAPVVLAKTFAWTPSEPETPASRESPSPVLVITGGLLIAGIIIFMAYRRTRRVRPVEDVDVGEVDSDAEWKKADDAPTEENRETDTEDKGVS